MRNIREKKKREMIAKLRELSVDGVAPRAMEHTRLRGQACKLFGSWESFCNAAGVVSRRKKPGGKILFRKGQLREVLGAWDELDESERR